MKEQKTNPKYKILMPKTVLNNVIARSESPMQSWGRDNEIAKPRRVRTQNDKKRFTSLVGGLSLVRFRNVVRGFSLVRHDPEGSRYRNLGWRQKHHPYGWGGRGANEA